MAIVHTPTLPDVELTEAEKATLTARSDARAVWTVFCQFALTLAIFSIAAVWPNPLTIVGGTLLLGGRLLGFFVLTHECGHRTLFSSAGVNQWVGDWLLSSMDLTNGRAYMREHLRHHRLAGTAEDPDLANYGDYPISRERLKRKLKRDITGQTGWRNLKHKLQALVSLRTQDLETRDALLRGVLANSLMLAVMTYIGAPWLYLCGLRHWFLSNHRSCAYGRLPSMRRCLICPARILGCTRARPTHTPWCD